MEAMLRFDLIDLRIFLHIVEQGTITGGAARAHLSLAAASARLSGMEKTLGTALLIRGRRGVRPTPAGHSLVHHARMVLDHMARLHGELREHARGIRGHVSVLGNTAAISEYLPEPLGRFLIRHPAIDVSAEELRSDLIVRAIAAGRADLGIVADSAPLGDLERFPLRSDRLAVVVPALHSLARRKRLRFRDLLGCDFVGLGRDSALRAHLDRHAASQGKTLRYRVTFRSFDALGRIVADGVGIAIVPASVAERFCRTLNLAMVPLQDRWANRQLLVVMRRRDELPIPAQQLANLLIEGEAGSARPDRLYPRRRVSAAKRDKGPHAAV